ncbi:MAG: hypothetical protein HOI53_08355 [Francisellaceae bacterium]|jgi:putative tryptophan/tyrosine transport system substrate-binding protein|nr:hypothetical protein [Francisellaceae bacterium]MBT6208026.1 hypothetical protein [Francisellaceae bacterium]MBT6538192.1 hypothetical protein [Francisellaceae bacterium]
MKNILMIIIAITCHSAVATTYDCTKTNVGMILPLKHKSLDLIADGFKMALTGQCPNSKISIKNAYGDMLSQSMLIKQFSNDSKIDYVVTIGTVAAQMASSISKKPILALAANKEVIQNDNMYFVSDELPANIVSDFLTSLMPNINQITIIHSMNDKVHKELKAIELALGEHNVTLQKLSVNNISDIYRVVNQISVRSDLVLMLKDHVVVSAVPLLHQHTMRKDIPLVSLDEGSVKSGADLGIGVIESEIGEKGAKLIMSFNKPKITTMKNLTVFYHNKTKQISVVTKAMTYAQNMNYQTLEVIGGHI